MAPKKRSPSKRAKPDEIAMLAADRLLTILTELHIAYSGMTPRRLTIGQRNIILGNLQEAADTLPVIMNALATIGASIGIEHEAEAA